MNTNRRGRPRPSPVPALAFILTLAFAIVPGAAHAARGQVGPPVLGVNWFTVPENPCDGQDVRLMFTVCECQVDLQYAGLDSTNGLVHVLLGVRPDIVCVTCHPDTFGVDLGQHAAGFYERTVRIGIEYEGTPDSTWPPSPVYDRITYGVARRCGSPTGVAYLDQVTIGRPRPCEGCPPLVCPGDSIDVRLDGSFPDDCTWFKKIELVPPPYASPLPYPPILQLFYERSSCVRRACQDGPIPWSAQVRLPGLPPMGGFQYQLVVDGHLVDTCLPGDSLGLSMGTGQFPFTVADSCSTQVGGPCFSVAWSKPDSLGVDDRRIGCLATYSESHNAPLVLHIGSPAPIAGVQGKLVLDANSALAVRNVTALQPGWQLVQTPNPSGGVDFITFAGPGALPIQPRPDRAPVPLLSLTVDPNQPDLPDQARLTAVDLIASDPAGAGIPMCPVIILSYPPPNVAILCKDVRPCDVNRDGATDVRDLVRMMQCLNPPPNVRLDCPTSAVLDCDRDQQFDFDDVFCCARVMLGGYGGGPGDSLRRDAPEIAVGFGVPRVAADGTLEVPLRFDGMAGVSAARVDVAYPDDRYEVLGVAFDTAPADWWTATHVAGGRVGLAILDLGTTADAAPVTAEATLRLRLRAGATAGGELAVAKHDFAAPDGVALVTPHADGSVALGAVGTVALSTPRPNPFGATVTFALTMPAPGGVDVAVFNSAGRRVATLLRDANAPAGVYTLAWNGTDASGARAAGGVYFVRVVAGGAETSRKVLFLPGGVR